jgi:hypothetical protein
MIKSNFNKSIWDSKQTKLSILVPTREMVHSQFSYCLAQLLRTTSEVNLDTYLFFDSSTILLNQREKLIEKAKEVRSDYVLWLDSDMMFPSTTAIRLLQHDKDIVACNYMKRTKPLKTVAYTDLTNWDSWLRMEPYDGLVKVQGVGMGCMLMKTSVFDSISKPYFEFRYDEETKDWHGEDFLLQKKLRDQGYEIHIDTLLSMEIKHVGLYAY